MTATFPSRADVCTPLRNLIGTAICADSVGADFKKATWTFKVGASQGASGGRYLLVPEIVARLALENEEAGAGGIHLAPYQGLKAEFSSYDKAVDLDTYDSSGRSVYTLRRRHVPPEKYAKNWHPAHWCGSLQYRRSQGRRYNGPYVSFVTNDFGDLVEVEQS